MSFEIDNLDPIYSVWNSNSFDAIYPLTYRRVSISLVLVCILLNVVVKTRIVVTKFLKPRRVMLPNLVSICFKVPLSRKTKD